MEYRRHQIHNCSVAFNPAVKRIQIANRLVFFEATKRYREPGFIIHAIERSPGNGPRWSFVGMLNQVGTRNRKEQACTLSVRLNAIQHSSNYPKQSDVFRHREYRFPFHSVTSPSNAAISASTRFSSRSMSASAGGGSYL